MGDKIKLADLLQAFEDAFYAGWEARELYGGDEVSKHECFERWVNRELDYLNER
jgi:hypothetical protein